MFKKNKIVFINHPHSKGYAKLKDVAQSNLVFKLGGTTQLNSMEFEKFQEKAATKGVEVFWIS